MQNIIDNIEEVYKKIDNLNEIKVDRINWVTYYIDMQTEEKWIEEYLHPEMQAGGFPQLRLIEKFPWE